MEFNSLSAHEKAAVTQRELQRRKEIKARGAKQAEDYLYDNSYKIQKAKRGIKKSKPAW